MTVPDVKIKVAVDDETGGGWKKIQQRQRDTESSMARGTGGGWLGRAGATLRSEQVEKRRTGEGLLERVVSRGPAGMMDAGADLLGIANFGIAAAAIDQIGKAMSGAAEAVNKFKEGKSSVADMTDALVRQVPVTGSLYGGIRDLAGAIDGSTVAETRMIQRMAEGSKAAREQMAAFANLHDTIKKAERAMGERVMGAGVLGQEGNAFTARLQAADARFRADQESFRELRNKADSLGPKQKEAELAHIADLEREAAYVHDRAVKDVFAAGAKAQLETENDAARKLETERSANRQQELENLGRHGEAVLEGIRQSGKERLTELEKQEQALKDRGVWTPDVGKSFAEQRKVTLENTTLREQGANIEEAERVRAAAEGRLSAPAAAEGRLSAPAAEQEREVRPEYTPANVPLPSLTISARGSGMAQKQTEQGSTSVTLARLQEANNKEAKRTADGVEALVTVLSANPSMAAALQGVN
jgi:hypothetical protein